MGRSYRRLKPVTIFETFLRCARDNYLAIFEIFRPIGGVAEGARLAGKARPKTQAGARETRHSL